MTESFKRLKDRKAVRPWQFPVGRMHGTDRTQFVGYLNRRNGHLTERSIDSVRYVFHSVIKFLNGTATEEYQYRLAKLAYDLKRGPMRELLFRAGHRPDKLLERVTQKMSDPVDGVESELCEDQLKRLCMREDFILGLQGSLTQMSNDLTWMKNKNALVKPPIYVHKVHQHNNEEVEQKDTYYDKRTESYYVKQGRLPLGSFFLSNDFYRTTRRRNGILMLFRPYGPVPKDHKKERLQDLLNNLKIRTPYISHGYGPHDLEFRSPESRFHFLKLNKEEFKPFIEEVIQSLVEFKGDGDAYATQLSKKIRLQSPQVCSSFGERMGHVLIIPCSSQDFIFYSDQVHYIKTFFTLIGRSALFVCVRGSFKEDDDRRRIGSSFVIKGHQRSLSQMKEKVIASRQEETEAYPMLTSRSGILMDMTALSEVHGFKEGQKKERWIGYRPLMNPLKDSGEIYSNQSLYGDQIIMVEEINKLNSKEIESREVKAKEKGIKLSLAWGFHSVCHGLVENDYLVSFHGQVLLLRALTCLNGLTHAEILYLLKGLHQKNKLDPKDLLNVRVEDLTEHGIKALKELVQVLRGILGIKLVRIADEKPEVLAKGRSDSDSTLRMKIKKYNASSWDRISREFILLNSKSIAERRLEVDTILKTYKHERLIKATGLKKS